MAKSWSKRHVDAVAAYVAYLQAEVDLHAWHLRVMGGPAPKPHRGSLAVTWIANESNEANIYVNERFFTLSRREQRQTLTHELVHLLAERPQQFIRTSFTPLATDEDGAAAAKEWLRIMYERMVDDLAWILAERLPLPPRGWLD